jgi:hypothetical protein
MARRPRAGRRYSEVVLSEAQARELADEFAHGHKRRLAPRAKELQRGWYFSWQEDGLIGSHGLAVNKETGRVFTFGSAFPIERDLRMYDRGMDAKEQDIVITAIADLEETVAILLEIEPKVTEPSYEAGTVWRIPRCLTEEEIRARLASLPAVFPDQKLYFRFEAVEAARSSGCCVVELFPRPGNP